MRRVHLIPALALLMMAVQTHALTILDVEMDTGAVVGGTTPNGGIFFQSNGPNPSTQVGDVTADHVTFFSNQGAGVGTSQAVTFSALHSPSGAQFFFDVVLTGFQNDNGTISVVGLNDTGCCSVGVDSFFSSDTNDQFEADGVVGNPGQSEFLRASIENINVINPGTLDGPLEVVGIYGATIRTQTGQGDMGDIYVAGIGNTVGNSLLAQWDNNQNDVFRHFLTFAPTGAIDLVPTFDQAALQGLRIRFQTVDRAADVPEPATVSLGLLAFGALAARRRRARAQA